MVDASRRLCEIEGVSEDALFVWVDFSSIPQKNKFMQRLSISTLGVYASLCKFFVVVAPQALQRDSNVRCDAATYRRRGWCRLEQVTGRTHQRTAPPCRAARRAHPCAGRPTAAPCGARGSGRT